MGEPVARHVLHRAFVEIRRRWPFEMFACALLPDHIHCIWTLPRGDDDFPLRWASIKRRFTQMYMSAGGRSLPVSPNRTRHRERGVWQPRYWEHLIRNEHEMLVLRDYIHLNPVKHGYVRDPLDWAWSSVHRHNRLGWLEPDWTSRTPLDIDIVAE